MPVDLYSLPHKALRHALAEAGTRLAAAAPSASEDGTLALVALALDDLDAHGHHEDEHIHPVLRRLLPGLAEELDAQHAALTARIASVRRQVDLLATDPSAAVAAYRSLQRLAAANLTHLDHEEVVVLPALLAATPPGTTEEIMAGFQAAHPDAADLYRRWPQPLTAAERTLLA